MANRSQSQIAAARETRAWRMRSRGWTQHRIADELGMEQGSVSRMLDRIETRELKRLSGSVGRVKAVQNAQLEHAIEESMDAWHRSKNPRKRAARKEATAGGSGSGPDEGQAGDSVQTTEVIERDGDPAHLYCAMGAMDRQRSLWGLDVAAAQQEPVASVAELAKSLLTTGDAYQKRRKHEAQADPAGDSPGPVPADRGGVAAVSAGPESV
jgi:hypothetical protein